LQKQTIRSLTQNCTYSMANHDACGPTDSNSLRNV